MIELSVEQIAAIYFAAGIVCSVIIVKATKSYTWFKSRVAWAHRKLIAIESKVPEALKEQYAAVKEAVAAADAAMEDDKIDAAETELIVNKAVAAVKSLVKLVKG
jgi:hypothetical protein